LSQERMEVNQSRDISELMQSLISPRQGEPVLARARAERFGLDVSHPMSLMLVELDNPVSALLARRLRAHYAWPELVLDGIDGVLAFVCGTTRVKQLLDTFGDFARR